MITHNIRFLILFLAAFCIGIKIAESTTVLKNQQYELTLLPDNSIEVKAEDVPVQKLVGEFIVMYSERNLGFGINRIGRFDRRQPSPYPRMPTLAQRWAFYSNDPKSPNKETDLLGAKGDIKIVVNSRGERTFVYKNAEGKAIERAEGLFAKGTMNPYLAGQKTILKAVKSSSGNNSITWLFDEQPNFSLTAEVVLPTGDGDPQIRYSLKVKKDGFYSTAFTGLPWVDSGEVLPVPQETAERGFSQFNYVMSEAHMAMPRVHIATEKMNSVLVIDPNERPFRLVMDSKGVWTYSLASESNSRFGMMMENKSEGLRQVAFAPIMGGYESRMNSGDTYNFAVRYVLRPGNWEETYKYVAKNIYRFRDMRDNSGTGPLNNTVENIMDYLSDRDGQNYCMWHNEQKYYNYWSDQSGTFKPFSPMFGLAAAILTDDEEFYKNRALPMIEFALSRKHNVFMPYNIYDTGMVSAGRRDVGSPYPDTGPLVSLGGMFQNRTYAFKYYAGKKGFKKYNFMDSLARYRMTGKKEYLNDAIMVAKDGGDFRDMLEMYEETKNEKYLNRAVKSAYHYLSRYNMFPMVPDAMVTVDKDNKVPIHGHAYQRHEDWGFSPPQNLYAPEQTVPAWRASLVGVQLDVYRGGYWISNHGQFMRLAAYAKDDFLRDMQRWAMVGRYANYAGDFRSIAYSLVAELPDAPMHYIYQTDYSTFNPGHACEWIGAVMDFLISDAFNRSEKQIDFPSRCMYESGFRVKVYGDRPGQFYDENNVQPWLPRHLLKSDNKQVDYVAGYGNGKFYLAFWNQSFKTEDVTITLNSDLVECNGAHKSANLAG